MATGVPHVDQQVTYTILLGYDARMPTTASGSVYAPTMFEVCS